VDELMALCDELEAARTKREIRRDHIVAATLHKLNNGDASPEAGNGSDFKETARFYFNHLPRLTTRPEHIKQLRQTTLKLGICGKLTAQKPNESVSGAIPEIIPGTAPFEVPPNWRWTVFGEIATITGGYAFKSGDYSSGGVFVLRVTNIEPTGVITKKDSVFMPKKKIGREIEKFYLNAGDILLVMVGGSLGKTGVVTSDVLPALLNQNLWRIMPAKEEVDHRYLKLLVDFIILFQRKITHSTHGHLSREEFRQKPISLPPFAEQHRIVAKVDELMALCDKLEDHLTTTAITRRQLLEATLHEALSGSLEHSQSARCR
jgi:type I restriction enzyme S subunit